MVSFASALLDELMGRNRNNDPNEKPKDLNWADQEVSATFYNLSPVLKSSLITCHICKLKYGKAIIDGFIILKKSYLYINDIFAGMQASLVLILSP